ncbi:MAG: hypothetical protein R2713_01265 [Ilumatobacteraceae bacterium]
MDRKIRALLRHETQHLDPSMEQRVRTWMGMTASQFGLPEGRCAEGSACRHPLTEAPS